MSRSPLDARTMAQTIGVHPPTAEQQAVIEAAVDRPVLVVAGAGSGKTQTMSLRVAWLVANGHAEPRQILGLTFTRKAASELSERIGRMLRRLEAAGLVPPGEQERDEFDRPRVATYNSFGADIYRDGALLLGRDPEAVLLDENSAWRLMWRVAHALPAGTLLEQGVAPATAVERALAFEQALSAHGVTPQRLEAFVAEFLEHVAALPPGPRGLKKERDRVEEALQRVASLPAYLELAQSYRERKRERGYLEFHDQIALALDIARTSASLVSLYREESRFVLLDEYQDTSVQDAALLAELFAGHPVMAVGDPNQSIYGWRGASANNLAAFPRQFGAASAPPLTLSTSWRNDRRILRAANVLARPLRDAPGAVAVEELLARPEAGEGRVEAVVAETVGEEADAVADWLAERIAVHPGRPSAAILFRARRWIPLFARALHSRGVPYHVLGLGGLLDTPEVRDVICAIRVLGETNAGPELLRLLAGGRWRIGVRDLEELRALASWLADRDGEFRLLPAEVLAARRERPLSDRPGLVEALEVFGRREADNSLFDRFSPAGRVRLHEAAEVFARLRRRIPAGLPVLVREIVRELRLDVEAVANERLGGSGLGAARLDALDDVVASFLQIEPEASLPEFLAWLDRVERNERYAPPAEPPEPGAVQLTTAHSAKGLEWDLVVVPRLGGGSFPAALRESNGWLSPAQLPAELRGDAESLPQFRWRQAHDEKEFAELLSEEYKPAVAADHALEERRLAYVAVTRAREELLLSTSFWDDGQTQRPLSPYLAELSEAGLIELSRSGSEHTVNPGIGAGDLTVLWPGDPLLGRRERVERAAAEVRAAMAEGERGAAGALVPPAARREIELLLAEREQREQPLAVPIPSRITASRFHEYVTDPAAVAASLARPMPTRPYRETVLGTRFHSWVERRAGLSRVPDDELALSGLEELVPDGIDGETERGVDGEREVANERERGEQLAEADAERLARLMRTFEASEWGGRRPVEVEREIHLPFAGRVLVCKIDAVFAEPDPRAPDDPAAVLYEIVDWKTGRPPRGARELEQRQLQLALYRHAFSQWKGVDPERVRVAFYYVEEDLVVRPERVYDEAGLLELWSSVERSWSAARS